MNGLDFTRVLLFTLDMQADLISDSVIYNILHRFNKYDLNLIRKAIIISHMLLNCLFRLYFECYLFADTGKTLSSVAKASGQ